MPTLRPLDKDGMRRWCRLIGVLSGLVLIISLGASTIRGRHGWLAVPERALAIGVGLGALGMVASMVMGQFSENTPTEIALRPRRKYVRKKKPVLRTAPGRKRAYKKAIKRRRARKA